MAQGVPEWQRSNEKKERRQVDRREADKAASQPFGADFINRPQVAAKAKSGPERLAPRRSRKKFVVADPVARHDGCCSNGSTTCRREDERARPIEAADKLDGVI